MVKVSGLVVRGDCEFGWDQQGTTRRIAQQNICCGRTRKSVVESESSVPIADVGKGNANGAIFVACFQAMFSKAFGEANNEVAREVYRGAGVCRSLWREPRVSCDLLEGGLRDSGCVIGREAEVGLIEAAANIERVIREAIEAETYRQQSGRSERNRVLDAGGIH